ncbi:MAG: ABC transporter permease [Bacteroidota bacterium]
MTFDLEKSIAAWRRSYEVNPAFSNDDLEELENSLRDRVEDAKGKGISEKKAFYMAIERIGSMGSAEQEYKKVYWGKVQRENRLKDELLLKMALIKSYVKVAFRNLHRNLAYSVINVLGLAVGMASCLLIGLYVGDELSYDEFHAAAERIQVMGVGHRHFGRSMATPYPLASVVEENVPAVDRAVRTLGRGEIVVRRPDHAMTAKRHLLLVDQPFFEVFDFALIRGHQETALDAPDAAVITQSMARDFFGDEDPMGKVIEVEFGDVAHTLVVRGLTEDVPRQSTIQFDILVPLSLLNAAQRDPEGWGKRMFMTYALLNQPMLPDTLAAQVQRAAGAILSNTDRQPPAFFSMPLTQLYLSDQYNAMGFRGQQRYLYIFGAVALFILLIAAINYVNLVTAQAQRRAREVGVRKTMGGGRGQLAFQFLSESLLLVVAALVLALGLTALLLPLFNASFGTVLTLLGGRYGLLLAGLALAMLLAGVTAGAYPAFVLSRYQPIGVLRGTLAATTGGGGWLRRGLVVLQFSLSTAIIVGTMVVYQQLDFMQMKNLGFDGEQVVVVQLPQSDLTASPVTVRAQLLQHPAVEHVSLSNVLPAHAGLLVGMPPDEVSPEANTHQEIFSWVPVHTDSAFVETLGLQLVAGRSFGSPAGAQAEVLINELAARQLGWLPGEAIDKPFWLESGGEGVVVGVVKNFHHTSLREEIMPVVITLGDEYRRELVAIKLAAKDITAGMDHVREVLGTLMPNTALDYQFIDDAFDAMYRSEKRLSQIFTAFAGIAIFISCLGLLGLAAYAAQRRTKEIGIRKVMGASLMNIISLLSKEFAALLAVALMIGMPVAYWAMHRWLEDFAFRTSMSGWTFVVTALLVLLIAGGSVSINAIRAASTNPTDALRCD